MANKESTCAYSIDSVYKNRFVEDINFHKIEVLKCIRLVYHFMATIHIYFLGKTLLHPSTPSISLTYHVL